MKAGGTTKSRYDKLKPAIEQAFDIPGMTALSVGPSWSSISPADQKALIEAFDRMTIANYARNFDSYSGEKFTVDPAVTERGSRQVRQKHAQACQRRRHSVQLSHASGGRRLEDRGHLSDRQYQPAGPEALRLRRDSASVWPAGAGEEDQRAGGSNAWVDQLSSSR